MMEEAIWLVDGDAKAYLDLAGFTIEEYTCLLERKVRINIDLKEQAKKYK